MVRGAATREHAREHYIQADATSPCSYGAFDS
jgi:hypothetical protein